MQRYNNYTIIKISITKIENTICPTALDKLDEKWGEKYPIVIKPWRDNWDRMSEFTICPVLKEGYILLVHPMYTNIQQIYWISKQAQSDNEAAESCIRQSM